MGQLRSERSGDAVVAQAGSATAFHKYEGLGNDFVVIDASAPDVVSVEHARAWCDRRLGIGADGVLLSLPGQNPGADGRMIVINADGSIPEMCGNGLRCVALHVARTRGMREGTLVFDTDAGTKRCSIDDRDGRGLVTVDMGSVRFLEDVRLNIDGTSWELSLADAGNPHAITRQPATREQIEKIGPRIERHPRFAAGTNVEFAVVRSTSEIEIVVWERGVGITQACGTGACSTAAEAVAKGWAPVDTEIGVRLPGGVLAIRITPDGRAIMRGPARHVFDGTLSGTFFAERQPQ
jgi:diaminopimelate epimerase